MSKLTGPNKQTTGSLPAVKTAAPFDRSRYIEIFRKPDETDDQAAARMLIRGTVANATTVIDYSRQVHPDLSLTDLADALKDQGEAVNGGDLAALERMLNGQAVALNAMFTELARRGARNMGENLDAADRYIRLALKAQAQARATVEALAEIKNPRAVAFVKQANIAHGPQQVNNGTASRSTRTGAHAGETQIAQSKLLEASDVERVDTGTQSAAGKGDPELAPVGKFHRAKDSRR